MKTQIPVTKFAPFPVHHFAAALVLLLFGLPQTAAADVVTEWNQYTRDAIAASAITGNSIASARVFAIVHASMYDALNGVEGRFTPYHVDAVAPAGASRRAAVIQAAYSALAGLFPSQIPSLDVKLAASLAAITDDGNYQDSVSIARGRDWGALVAADILAWRSSDGFNTSPPPFTGGLLPGQWRPTPPGFAPMNCAQCATMVPFAIASPSQFRPVGPPALESAAYATDLNEVKALGRATGSTRTAEQTAIARFWAGQRTREWDSMAGARPPPHMRPGWPRSSHPKRLPLVQTSISCHDRLMRLVLASWLILLILGLTPPLPAQDDWKFDVLHLKNKERFEGLVIEDGKDM
ncbi:MAG: hypothetical protein L0099_09990, partial [Acidobacteria bacterium]|nr:hypothetical protein [Acidobacteriota bacterium]